MARIDNAITFGSGFNISATAPIDSRMLVEYEDDLISSTTWPADKAPVYDGMTVTVKATGDIWVLLDKTKYTDKTTGEGWVKSGGDIDIDVTPDEVYEFLTNTVLYLSSGNSVMLTSLTSEDIAQYKTSLVKVQIGDNVTDIDGQMFSGCTGLTSVLISDSITSIGENAFRDCSGLTSVTIPNSVTSIGDAAFYGCSGLTSVTIGNSVTSIGQIAFYSCTSLTSVTIGNNVISIGGSAFYDCGSLTSVTIPNSVTSIGDNAFYDVPHIEYYGTATGAPWGALSMN